MKEGVSMNDRIHRFYYERMNQTERNRNESFVIKLYTKLGFKFER